MARPVKGFIVIVGIVGVVVLTYVGWIGIAYEETLQAGACSERRTQYTVRPFLRQLELTRPSFDAQLYVEQYNAYARVLQCLCRDRASNRKRILAFVRAYDASRLGQMEIAVPEVAEILVETACTSEATPRFTR